MTHWTEIQWCREHLPKAQLSSVCHMTPTVWTKGKRKKSDAKTGISVLPETVPTKEIPSHREPHNLIILSPLISSIISHNVIHLTWLKVPPDPGLKLITATPRQQIFHASRSLYMLSDLHGVPAVYH